jgi:hypothetical protein
LDSGKRKSILECDVNAYELIAKYLKNGNRCDVNGDKNSAMLGECGRSGRVSSGDDVLDDELSDDLSDNAVENSSVRASDFTGLHSLKTAAQTTAVHCSSNTDVNSRHKDSVTKKQLDTRGPPSGETRHVTSTSTSSRSAGVTLGGQRIRIFNEPRGHPLPEENNINVDSDASIGSEFATSDPEAKDFEVGTSGYQERIARNTVAPSSLIPRLASPRRPPRKTKASPELPDGCSGDMDILAQEEEEHRESESGGVNSRDTAASNLSQPKDARPSSAAEGGSIIKSILKKPSCSLPGETPTSLKTFSDTISKPDYTLCAAAVNSVSSGQQNSPSPAPASSGSGDFYLPTFQEYKQQQRKKKQVQFKVANDSTELKPVEGDHDLDVAVSATKALISTAVITSQVSPVEEGKVEAQELNNELSSLSTDKWPLCDKEEAEPLRRERRNETTLVKEEEEEDKLDFQKEDSEISSENCKTLNCDKDKLKSPVDDNVKAGDSNRREGVRCDEGVRLQYFGAGDVEVVNSGNVSCGDVASRSRAERVKDADDGNSTDDTPAVSGDNSDSTETTSGEYLHKY